MLNPVATTSKLLCQTTRSSLSMPPHIQGSYSLSLASGRLERVRASEGPCNGATLICGRFEGVDQRVLDHFEIEEVSLGDYVLTGGEIAAQAVIDSTVRLLPGVLGNAACIVVAG